MSGISTAISVLVSSVFVAAIIKIIAPVGNTEKILRLVISLFVLICLAVSFGTIFDSLKVSSDSVGLSEKKEENIHRSIDSDVLKATGDYIAEYMNKLISAEGVDTELVEVSLDTDENSVIKLTGVNIYIEQKDLSYEKRIIEIVEDYLEITPMVIIRE